MNSAALPRPRHTLAQDALAVLIMLALACAAGALLVQHRRATQPKHPRLTLAEMQAYVAAGDVLILDARSRSAFAAGHIPHALNLSINEWNSRSAELYGILRQHRDRLVIVYCTSQWCDQSDELQAALIELGHAHVGVFADGFDAWRAAGLTVEKSP